MDLNKLAKEVTLREGKKVSISIAQVREVIRCTFEVMTEWAVESIPKPKFKKKKVGKR